MQKISKFNIVNSEELQIIFEKEIQIYEILRIIRKALEDEVNYFQVLENKLVFQGFSAEFSDKLYKELFENKFPEKGDLNVLEILIGFHRTVIENRVIFLFNDKVSINMVLTIIEIALKNKCENIRYNNISHLKMKQIILETENKFFFSGLVEILN